MPEQDSVGIVETQYATIAEPPDEMVLDSGLKLGPITLAYETYGELNADKSNAILITHGLSGDAHVAGYHDPDERKPGWWDAMVGPGKAFDTSRYFIICSNVIGGCMGSTGPASIDPKTGKPFGLTFPIITVADMVHAQVLLMDQLGIDTLLAVAGGSMGGMQTLEWAVAHPERLRAAIVVASTHICGAQSIAFDAVGRNAIQADRAFKGGHYYGGDPPASGLSIARMLAHITYLSDESMRAKFGRALRDGSELRYEVGSEFSVEAYLDYQGEQFVNRFDANSYLYITKAIDYFDISARYGSLDEAMSRVRCKVLVLAYSSDWLYPAAESEAMVYALARQGRDVSYCCIESDYGHDAFLLEVDTMYDVIGGFLDHALPHQTCCVDCANTQDRGPKDEAQRTDRGIYKSQRIDYDFIVDLVEEGSRVLDVGCGDGELLCRLIERKHVRGTGIELSQDRVARCVQRGICAVQADVDKGLEPLMDQSFDYVILGMTLQVVQKPDLVISEMLRVGRKCIVSFPNFGHWSVRLKALLSGRAPVTPSLPFEWHDTPNFHVLSLKDFRDFCKLVSADIEQEIPLNKRGVGRHWPNLLAEDAVYVITGQR